MNSKTSFKFRGVTDELEEKPVSIFDVGVGANVEGVVAFTPGTGDEDDDDDTAEDGESNDDELKLPLCSSSSFET